MWGTRSAWGTRSDPQRYSICKRLQREEEEHGGQFVLELLTVWSLQQNRVTVFNDCGCEGEHSNVQVLVSSLVGHIRAGLAAHTLFSETKLRAYFTSLTKHILTAAPK